MGKVKTLSDLRKIVVAGRRKGKRIVFTNGCFDLIHPGHIKVFRQAKKKGDVLIVGLNSDSSVKKIKGPRRPILDERSRAKVLEAIEYIDYIVFFTEPTPQRLIKVLRPDVLVKGGDWSKNSIVGSDMVKKVYRVASVPGCSTTKMIAKIKRCG